MRAIDYEAARQIARPRGRGRASSRRRGTGTSRPGAPSRCAPRRRPTTTATSPSPTWCRWRRTRRGRQRVRAGLGPHAGRPPGRSSPPRSAATPSEAEADQIRAVVDLGLDGLVDGGRRGRRAGRAGAGPCGQRGGGPERGRAAASTPASFAALLAMESGGQLSATQSKAVLGALLERGGGDPAAVAKEMGFEALGADTLRRRARRGDRRAPRRVGALRRRASDKLRASSPGKVMQATSGKANGKEVAAELRRRRERAGAAADRGTPSRQPRRQA